MLRLLPLVFLLAACQTTNYSDQDEAKETCRDLGLKDEAYERCVARREHEAACRHFANSREYTVAEARKRQCE